MAQPGPGMGLNLDWAQSGPGTGLNLDQAWGSTWTRDGARSGPGMGLGDGAHAGLEMGFNLGQGLRLWLIFLFVHHGGAPPTLEAKLIELDPR